MVRGRVVSRGHSTGLHGGGRVCAFFKVATKKEMATAGDGSDGIF